MLLTYAILIFAAAQTLAWFQINSQFVSEWCKDKRFILSLLGVPISYLLITATGMTSEALQGKVWPGRFLTFAVGIIIFTVLTTVVLGEAFTWKTAVNIMLTLLIIFLQVL
jgi:hypothetical protein